MKPTIVSFKFNSPTESILQLVNQLALGCLRINIAVAYLTREGLFHLKFDKNARQIRILCGVESYISDLNALKEWTEGKNIVAHVYCGGNIFHPKIYLFEYNNKEGALLLGSANLTGRGLTTNEEACMLIKAHRQEKMIKDALKFFNDLWNNQSISVDDFLKKYPDYEERRIAVKSQVRNESFLSTVKRDLLASLISPLRSKLKYKDIGQLSGTIAGYHTIISHKGKRHFECIIDGKRKHRLEQKFVEQTLGLQVNIKRTGGQVGYPSEPVPRAVWRELSKRYNRSDPDVKYRENIK